jgi:prepilin-type N-terminal cleavage/methylation domain-containing protein
LLSRPFIYGLCVLCLVSLCLVSLCLVSCVFYLICDIINQMKKGFTLIELLIGITIFAIISGAVYTSLYLGIKVWKHEENSSANIQEMTLTFDLLGKSLRSVFMNPDNENIKFKGSTDKLEFYTVNSAGRLEDISFYLQPSGIGSKDLFSLLVLRKKITDKPDQNETAGEIVNNRISGFKLSYFDKAKNQWFDEWPEELAAPNQVKAELDFSSPSQAGGGTLHLEKYISIPIANDLRFAFDQDTG